MVTEGICDASESPTVFFVHGRRLVGNPERRLAGQQLSNDRLFIAVASDAVDLDCAERGLVKADGPRGRVDTESCPEDCGTVLKGDDHALGRTEQQRAG